MIKMLGSTGLLVAGLAALLLFSVAAAAPPARQDGGRIWSALFASLPLLGGLLLAYGCGLAGAGFDWVLGGRSSSASRWLFVMVTVLSAVVVVALSAAVRSEPAEHTPWALWPVRGWAHWVWLPALLAGATLGLYPSLRQGLPTWVWQAPLSVLAGLSTLLCAGLLLQLLQTHAAEQARRVQAQAGDDLRRDHEVLAMLQQADVQRDFIRVLPHSSPFEAPPIRELARAKLAQHPDLDGALIAVLRSAHPDAAFAFLQANAPRSAAALAEPLREAIVRHAAQLHDDVSRTHTLRPDDYQAPVRRILASVDRFTTHPVDYRPALKQLRDAFDAPREGAVQPTPAMAGRRDIDEWLQSHAQP